MTTGVSRILESVPRESRSLVERFQKLQEIGAALSEEKDLGSLLELILRESRGLTHADSGSVYIRHDEVSIVENATARDLISTSTPYLLLKITQNDSISFPFREMKLPFDWKTVAGYVANSGDVLNLADVYNLPPGVPFSYNKSFDEASGYRCKSMLVVPMKNRHGEIIGVLQLINKKADASARLGSRDEVERGVRSFDPFDEELLFSLASQAAVCIEKARLYDEIEKMFEGLVQSFTLALERRNRTTYGHCMRVAQYAVAIAEAVNKAPVSLFGGLTYSKAQIKELRYAALLHDIGKIAVPEAVLDKRNKLLDSEVEAIAYRLSYWKHRSAADGKGSGVAGKIDGWIAAIRRANVPKPLSAEDKAVLEEIRGTAFTDLDGVEKPLLTAYEVDNLAIDRGNLTKAERKVMEHHIVDTWEILKRVPWPRDVRHVPNIAACHHEKVNGSGYPWGFKTDDIPLGGKILAIVDIYEALTAKDRPYKPAMPVEKALAILDDEEARGNIDSKLYRLFKERKIYALFSGGETGFVKTPADQVIPKHQAL